MPLQAPELFQTYLLLIKNCFQTKSQVKVFRLINKSKKKQITNYELVYLYNCQCVFTHIEFVLVVVLRGRDKFDFLVVRQEHRNDNQKAIHRKFLIILLCFSVQEVGRCRRQMFLFLVEHSKFMYPKGFLFCLFTSLLNVFKVRILSL